MEAVLRRGRENGHQARNHEKRECGGFWQLTPEGQQTVRVLFLGPETSPSTTDLQSSKSVFARRFDGTSWRFQTQQQQQQHSASSDIFFLFLQVKKSKAVYSLQQ